MGKIADDGKAAFRDYVTDGVPSTGEHETIKSDVRAWAQTIDDRVTAATEGIVVKGTWAELSAITGTGEGQAGRVVGADAGTHTDPVVGGTVDNLGEYAWSDTSPTGWERLSDLTYQRAETAATLAEQWAEEAEDSEVTTGQYSALHHAAKASASASAAAASAASIDAGELSNIYSVGTPHQNYLARTRKAREGWPKAAVVILIGQSLNQGLPTDTSVLTSWGALGKMFVAGFRLNNFPFYATNAEWAGAWTDYASVVDFEEDAVQTPGVGILATLPGGMFSQIYMANVAIGARTLNILQAFGPATNLQASIQRHCQIAIADGYDPYVMFYMAHGEADSIAGTTEADYYTYGKRYIARAQLWAAQAMGRPDYFAPCVWTLPASGYQSGYTYDGVANAIRRLAQDMPGGIFLGPIYQWPVNGDRVHPTPAGYIERGEAVGRALKRYFEQGIRDFAPTVVDFAVDLSTGDFMFTYPFEMERDTSIGVGENLNAANAIDGVEFWDNGTNIALSSLTYQGRTIVGSLSSAPSGTLAQQQLRIAMQTHTVATATYPANVAGTQIRASNEGWKSIYDYTKTNRLYATNQIVTGARAL